MTTSSRTSPTSSRRSDELKLIEGNFRPHRARDLPRFSAKVPEPPATLSPAARKHWRELARALADRRTMTAGDRQTLALCAQALAQHDEAQAILTASGSTYEAVTQSGTVLFRPRPEVRIAADSWARALRALIELGLTPRSRGGVEVAR